VSDPARKITARREKRRRRPKGYAAWSPQAKTRTLLVQVEAVLDEYREHLPLTVRQIFYRLVGAFGYEKSEEAYESLGDMLVRARRARRIPFDVIRDDGVVTYSSDWYRSQQEFWNATGRRIRAYRRDRQAGQPVRLELWCEAAGMAPQLARVADDYSVPVFSTGGFSSLSAIRLIADRALSRDVPTVLLHVGDHDPSGESIFEAIAADAAAFVEADRPVLTLAIRPKRVALTAEQVAKYDLPTAAAKRSDSRSRNWVGGTCQLEALTPDLLADLVRKAIEAELDPATYERHVALEAADVAELWRGLPRGTQ
jgi:hypothetical protein